MKLICLVVGGKGAAFPVNMSDPADIVGDLKKAIHAENINDLAMVDADKLTLYTTKRGDKWLRDESDEAKRVSDSLEKAGDWLTDKYKLKPTSKISPTFSGDLGDEVVHVLVKLPAEVSAKFSLNQARKHRMLLEMTKQQEEEARKIRERKEAQAKEQARLEKERARLARIPEKRIQSWEEMNEALRSGLKGGNGAGKSGNGTGKKRAFSSVGLEQLPEHFRPKRARDENPFCKLMENPPQVDSFIVDELLLAIERKTRVYSKQPLENEATRVMFMSEFLERVIFFAQPPQETHGENDSDQETKEPDKNTEEKNDSDQETKETSKSDQETKESDQETKAIPCYQSRASRLPTLRDFSLTVQTPLTGRFIEARGVADFVITNGTKKICVVEAKDYDFRQGQAQSVLGMEVLVDNDDEANEIVYGIATNYDSWYFLKRTDDGIESFIETINVAKKDIRGDVTRVVNCIYAILMDA